ncbi:MAG: response regulator [Flammeovirgaceae bacterium]|nr:response regulator [Flammeovirgaceae bacterium]
MKVLIIEDEPLAAERLGNLVRELHAEIQLVATLDSVQRSVVWLSQNTVDLIFMDIQLADGLSFEIFEKVEIKTPVIFTTAYNEYALKAFKVNSIDYILKPIDKEELTAAYKKYQTLTQRPAAPAKMLESIGYAMQLLTKKVQRTLRNKKWESILSRWR